MDEKREIEDSLKLQDDCDSFISLLRNMNKELKEQGNEFLFGIFEGLIIETEADLETYFTYYKINPNLHYLINVYTCFSRIESLLKEIPENKISIYKQIKYETIKLKNCFEYQDILNHLNKKMQQ